MLCAKLVFVLALSLYASNLGCRGEGSDNVMPAPPLCLNCTICEYPCYPIPPPPPSPSLPDHPSYGTPPPAPALPGSPSYVAPPPSPPGKQGSQGKCPPSPAIQCCQYPSPNAYGYVPYDNQSASSSLPMFVFVMVVSLSSVILL